MKNWKKVLKYTFLTKDIKIIFHAFAKMCTILVEKQGNLNFSRFLCTSRHFLLEFTGCSFRCLGCKVFVSFFAHGKRADGRDITGWSNAQIDIS